MRAIETFSLCKRFRRARAVHDLNLQVEECAVYALMGPNGAGKTTLIKMLMNLVSPDEGRATMLGGDASELRGKRLEAIGYVSENQKLPDWMTVGGFLSYWRPFYPTWDEELERRLVQRFELPRKQKLKSLSRGMRMKAALASVLSYRPKLLVLDEPLSGLDPLVRDELMAGLLSLVAETTVLISSHDLAEIDSFASHVGFMDAGRLRLSEPIGRVRERFRNVEIVAETGVANPSSIPSSIPAEWRDFEFDGGLGRWKETNFEPERSVRAVREVFGEVRVTTSPMTLREVFLTMARAKNAADGKAEGR